MKKASSTTRPKVVYTTVSPVPEQREELPRKAWLYVLLVLGFIALLVMLMVLAREVNRVAELEVQNRSLEATLQVLSTQKAQLQLTVQALQGALSKCTPVPGP